MESSFLKTILRYWNRLSPAWQSSLLVFLGARILFSLWSLVILSAFPTVVTNTIVYDQPAVLSFDMKAEKGFVYSRVVDGKVLSFEYYAPGQIIDTATHSIWSLEQGAAIQGTLAGKKLAGTDYPVENAFPMQPHGDSLLELWHRYDTAWYLKIAQSGYAKDDGSMAFLPLYPLLIRLFGRLFGNDLFAALLVSNISLFFWAVLSIFSDQ